MRLTLNAVLIAVTLLLVACGGGGDDTPESTQPAEEPPTATIVPETGVQEEPPAATNTPEPPQSGPPTLPPSWTPTTEATPTELIVTSTPQPQADQPDTTNSDAQFGGAATPRPECAEFIPDFASITSTFDVGVAPTVAWTGVANAALYRVFIFDELEFELHTALVEETSYVVPADVFLQPGFYIWQVEPLDSLGIQMCIGIGDVLTVE